MKQTVRSENLSIIHSLLCLLLRRTWAGWVLLRGTGRGLPSLCWSSWWCAPSSPCPSSSSPQVTGSREKAHSDSSAFIPHKPLLIIWSHRQSFVTADPRFCFSSQWFWFFIGRLLWSRVHKLVQFRSHKVKSGGLIRDSFLCKTQRCRRKHVSHFRGWSSMTAENCFRDTKLNLLCRML